MLKCLSPAAFRIITRPVNTIFTGFCFLCILLPGILFFSASMSLSGTIYYYQDEDGTFHFTDLPTSSRYSPFAVFRTRDPKPQDVIDITNKYGRLHSVDPGLIQAIIEVESGYNPNAVSRAGAQGLMQIMPGTQKDLDLTDPFEPEPNIEAGTKYFKYLLDRFESLPLALAAYNAGPSRVEHYNGIPPFKETQDYVNRVLERYAKHQQNR